jgi:peptide/nickel transport system substrate-binding protein/oligopeptide transport system substrate-binding protein
MRSASTSFLLLSADPYSDGRPVKESRCMPFRPRTFDKFGLLVLFGLLAILSVGCASNPAPLPQSHQLLRFPLLQSSVDIATMDPALVADGNSYVAVELVFPGLLTLNASGTPTPWAAQSMPTFDPRTNTYTFRVRPHLRWSDGTPIDANTFAYSINRALNPCIGSSATYYLYPIKDAKAFSTESCASDGTTIKGKIQSLIGDSLNVPDSQTLVITLGAPAPYFLEALTFPTSYAQPEQLISRYGTKHWTDHLTDHGGFSGNLFKIALWDHFGHLDLVRNTAFWGTPPKLSTVQFTIYQSLEAEYADYLDGRLDVASAPPAQYKATKARSDFHEVPSLSIAYYQPVWTRAPFDDVRVRQAFDLALDKDVLANQVDQGSVIPSNHIVPQGMPGYFPGLVGPDGSPSTSGNVAKATALMQSYANDKCGGKISKCTPVTLFDTSDHSVAVADQAAVNMWQMAFPGLSIRTRYIDSSTLFQTIYSANVPQIFGIGWIADYPDPQDWLSYQFGPTAGNNPGFVNVPAANTLMAEADQNLDPTSRLQEYNQAEQLLVTDCAWIPIYQGKNFWNMPAYVHNFEFDAQALVPLAMWQQVYLTSH